MRGEKLAGAAAICVHGAALGVCGLMLWAAGQPIFTDDAWWHLALGRAFFREGPWLDEDPLLFAAASAPSAASWLFDVAASGLHEIAGFTGLRLLHLATVGTILALAWSTLRRAGASAISGSLGTVVFVALAAYRLVQFRPHLFTILAALALYRLLIEGGRAPSWGRVGLAAALALLWANVHAAFPLAFLLLGAALVGVAFDAWRNGAPEDRTRARRLALALAGVALATLVNPAGPDAHLAYFVAGADTPDLGYVLDEWRPFGPFSWPTPTLPPSPLAWLLGWALMLGSALFGPRLWRARAGPRGDRPDPALLTLCALGLALMLFAARFLWLGIFPLLLLASAWRVRAAETPVWRGAPLAAAALAAVLLVPGFLRAGDWPAITRGLPKRWADYAQPYAAGKYYAQPIWMLADSRAEGRLYAEYFLGGFTGYWLAPRLKSLINGTLNVPNEISLAASAIALRRGVLDGESFPALLDRLGLDFFLGIRLPEVGNPSRPWVSTTAHLENTPGWLPVFRNLSSAVYLRANGANAANLERIARYYAERGVPFDGERGFDVEAVIRGAPEWSTAAGIVPRGFARLAHAARSGRGGQREASRDRVAALYAALGLYDAAARLDRTRLAAEPDDVRARRRLVWSLLRMRRFEEASEAAQRLAAQPASDGLSQRIARVAFEIQGFDEARADLMLAHLPFLARSELPWLMRGVPGPASRPPRPLL